MLTERQGGGNHVKGNRRPLRRSTAAIAQGPSAKMATKCVCVCGSIPLVASISARAREGERSGGARSTWPVPCASHTRGEHEVILVEVDTACDLVLNIARVTASASNPSIGDCLRRQRGFAYIIEHRVWRIAQHKSYATKPLHASSDCHARRLCPVQQRGRRSCSKFGEVAGLFASGDCVGHMPSLLRRCSSI